MEQEQRQVIRLGVRLLTWVKFLSTGKVHRALTRDIGSGGLCLVMEGVIEPGTKLELEIKLPDREAPITATAEVVWSRSIGEPAKSYQGQTAEIGVKFVNIDSKDRSLIMQYARLNALPPGSR
jgi:hypothetical protein